MSMTRKDYVALAEVIRGTVEQSGYVKTPEDRRIAEDIARGISEILSARNPAFDTNRFMNGCGVGGQR